MTAFVADGQVRERIGAAVGHHRTVGTADASQGAVDFEHLAAAGLLVQAVDVLRHQREAVAEPTFQLHQRVMARIRLDLGDAARRMW